MIELMVSITISLLLMLGISQIFLSSKTSYNLQNGVGRLQENARFALDTIARSVGVAGYSSNLTVVDSFNVADSLENESVNADLGFTVSSGQASDTIGIKHASPFDCLGAAAAGEVIDKLYIDGSNLMCLSSLNATPGVMAEGIENMQILYGEDTDNDGTANVYVSANRVVDWKTIVAVRVALLASTMTSVGSNDSKMHSLLNTPTIGPLNDNVLRRVFTRTILLRNK